MRPILLYMIIGMIVALGLLFWLSKDKEGQDNIVGIELLNTKAGFILLYAFLTISWFPVLMYCAIEALIYQIYQKVK